MRTDETFSARFEDMPQPAMLFEPNQSGFTYITCNRQYELLSPHYRFYPFSDALRDAATYLENVKLSPVKHADSYWQAEYQPIISNGTLSAIMCIWNRLPDDYPTHRLRTHLPITLNGTNNIKDNTLPGIMQGQMDIAY
jgi:hypothetical protein